MNHPLVSILIPVYGVEDYIARCASSLFEQSYENIEFIFVNDCTKDQSIEVLKKTIADYPKRREQVRIINHEHNKGLAGARNTAVAAARGKYLMHVDSDDFLIEPNAVEVLVEKCERDNLDMCFFDGKKYYRDKELPYSENIPIIKEDYLKLLLKQSRLSSIWGQMIKTSLYQKYNISCVEGLNFGEDYCVKPLLLYYTQRYAHLKACLYGYNNLNQNSYTYSFSISHTRQHIKAVEHLYAEFKIRDASDEILECLTFAKLKAKSRALNRWLASGNDIIDFNEIRCISVDTKYYSELPFKYRAYLSISDIFPAYICKILYKLFAMLR